MDEHPNVQRVRELLDAFQQGDTERVIDAHDPDLQWYSRATYRYGGHPVSRNELFTMLAERVGQSEGSMRYEPSAIWAVGEDLVVIHIKESAHLADRSIEDADFVMVVRLEDGKIVEGVDISTKGLDSFWE